MTDAADAFAEVARCARAYHLHVERHGYDAKEGELWIAWCRASRAYRTAVRR